MASKSSVTRERCICRVDPPQPSSVVFCARGYPVSRPVDIQTDNDVLVTVKLSNICAKVVGIRTRPERNDP